MTTRSQRGLAALPLALSTSVIALMISSPALAQGDDASSDKSKDNDNEIVVTAQFRAQNIQDTPLAITAVNAEIMQAKSQTNLAQVADSTPNVVLKPQGASFGPSIAVSIRGIGQGDFNPAYEPGVGIYIDDVYYPQLTGAVFDLLDLDRVEILRGPQGTLSGRNSEGGAIKMFSKKPDGSGGGYVEGTYGSRQRIGIRAGVDFSLTDSLFARISGVYKHQNGYVDQLDFGCVFPAGGENTAEIELVDIAVLVLVDPGDSGEQAVGQAEIDPGANADALAAAVCSLDIAAARAVGLLGEHLDRAAFGVSPRERALRPAQDLDPVEIEQVEHRAGELRIVYVVDIDADARLVGRVEVALADAADRDRDRRAEGCALRLQYNVGRAVGHLRQIGLALGLHDLRIDRGDRQRGVLDVLGPELRRDHDLVVVVLRFIARCIVALRQGGGRDHQGDHGSGQCKGERRKAALRASRHLSSPYLIGRAKRGSRG